MHSQSSLTRLDKRQISPATQDILCFSCVRNEISKLPYFIEYHRKLGINRFLFVDNDSDDGTVEYLMSLPDVHVFYADGSYARSSFGMDWLHELLNRYAMGHWALTLDADELLVFPGCEQLNAHQLVQYLEEVKAEGLATFLLDMYSDKPIEETVYSSGQPFVDTCPYFDSDTYQSRDSAGVPMHGGPRLRVFSKDGGHTPHLRKVPLVKWRPGLFYESSTHVIGNVSLSQLTGALLHFKFFSRFQERAELEVTRGEHWNNAAEYRSYLEGLTEQPKMNLYYEGSRKYGDSIELVELGLMHMPENFRDFSNSQTLEPQPKTFLSSLLSRFQSVID